MLNEAMRWVSAIQGVIENKAPIETPTQQLIRDIKVKMYCVNDCDTWIYTFLVLIARFGYSSKVCLESNNTIIKQ